MGSKSETRGTTAASSGHSVNVVSQRTDYAALVDHLLQSIRLRSSIFFRPELRTPWGFTLEHSGAVFHIVARGKCWLEVEGVAQPVRLSAGDFVVMPRGDLHVMRDERTSSAVNIFDMLKTNSPDEHGAFCAGGKGPVTRLVCGGMQFENSTTDPLLAVLPSFIHVKKSGQKAPPWLRAMLMQVAEELGSARAGASVVV